MIAPDGMQNGCFVCRLICGPQIVYPLDMLWMGVAQWNFLLVCVWLGHRSIRNQVGAQALTRFHPVDPKWEFPPTSPEPSK